MDIKSFEECLRQSNMAEKSLFRHTYMPSRSSILDTRILNKRISDL